MFIEKITMEELKRGLKNCKSIIIPFGSVEEHGPHLPLSTDTIQIIEILKIVEKEVNVFIAPTVHFGVCRSTEQHIGTVGISPNTLRLLTLDLLEGFKNQGFEYFFLVSGHAGKLHMFSLIEACESFVKRHDDVRVFVYSELDLIKDNLDGIIETEHDSHAGEIETSRMLYIDKNLVKGNYRKLKSDKPEFFPGEITSDKLKYWKSGIWGDPSKANIEKGKKTLALSAQKLIEIIKKIQKETI
ncbi:MAG: creatininase family protein [Proteobacteria bacterium]|nr:creatininase family protein [Pseudomonadota bacterium]